VKKKSTFLSGFGEFLFGMLFWFGLLIFLFGWENLKNILLFLIFMLIIGAIVAVYQFIKKIIVGEVRDFRKDPMNKSAEWSDQISCMF